MKKQLFTLLLLSPLLLYSASGGRKIVLDSLNNFIIDSYDNNEIKASVKIGTEEDQRKYHLE